MYIPSICILYEKDSKRYKNVYDNIIPILNSNIQKAVDGNTDELEEKLGNRKINKKFMSFCRRGQIACLLSHIEVWKKIIQNNVEKMLVLEDDAVLTDDFIGNFRLMYDELPKNWDFVYLYIHPDCKRNVDDKYKYINIGFKTYGTVGYLITNNTAKELINLFENNITTTVDDSISWFLNHYNKKYFCVKNNLIETGGNLYFHRNIETKFGSIIGDTKSFKENDQISYF